MPIIERITSVSRARPRSNSLRTTVPEDMAELLSLKPNDKIRWIYDTAQEGKILIVKVPKAPKLEEAEA